MGSGEFVLSLIVVKRQKLLEGLRIVASGAILCGEGFAELVDMNI